MSRKSNCKYQGPCIAKDCDNLGTEARKLCSKHYARLARTGQLELAPKNGRKIWRTTNDQGYIILTLPSGRRVREHRYVMEQYIGRELLPEETVHHINGVRDDNRLENLELWNSSHPCGQRVQDKVEWALEILKTYRRDLINE